MNYRHWSSLPYLDMLKPGLGWRVVRAVIATYSIDLVAAVASLLALAGRDNEKGSGSKVDFAEAHEMLRGKVRFLVQAGRVAVPAKTPPILAILDHFVREIDSDERQGSWHPKISLVKLVEETGQGIEWRVWIGSRNLTRDISWDTGMVLVGRTGGNGSPMPEMADIGRDLLQRADLPGFNAAEIKRELNKVIWAAPKGAMVEDIRLLEPGAKRGLPPAPPGLKELIVVSPFLDSGTLKKLGNWGDSKTRRTLLSIQPEIGRLLNQQTQPLYGFDPLLFLDAPEPENLASSDSDGSRDPAEDTDDAELESRGLHAKVIYAEHRQGRTLWIGSANATTRAWDGPNFEIVARMKVDGEIARGLRAFVELGKPVNRESVSQLTPDDPDEERLEEARKQVSARWNVKQKRHSDGPVLAADKPPHPDDADVELAVSLLGFDLHPWPIRTSRLKLPPVHISQETEFVRVRLRLGEHDCQWLQLAPLDPPPGEERDQQAIACFLDPKTFLQWIRSIMNEEADIDGGGEWSDTTRRKPGPPDKRPLGWAPTLEEMLRAWNRNRDNLRIADDKVTRYLAHLRNLGPTDINPDEMKELDKFERIWKTLRKELLQEQT